jgi:Zn-dependent peptidase ImmA (M78 family)
MQATARCIDIEGLANFLGLTVTYEIFAEKDFDKIGFLSDGKTPLLVRRGGRVVSFLFPLGTIVLDVSLHADKESGRCRFTIAHEIAHFMIDQHRPAAQYHRTFDAEKKYSVAEMNELFNIVENQADRLAAAILMPRFTVDRALDDFYKGKRIPVYGQNVIAPKEDKAISRMAAQIGVSYSAMLIRLRQFGLLDYHTVDEYFEKALHGRKA